MSSSSNPNVSPSRFQDLFDAALREYTQKTGKDITTEPLTSDLLCCDSCDAVLGILQEQARAFNQFRTGDWKVQLMRRLKPSVDILLGLSTSGVFGEGIGLRLPPAKAIFAGVGLLLAAAKGVSTSYDALMELFECFEHYLGRLKVLTEIPSAVGGILVKIMVELLDVLALATQQINQGRFKKLAKKLLGENDIEAVLQRLDRLTMEESRMTATQTMEVVYGLFNNMKVVMDDGKASIDNIREALVAMQKISDDLNKMKCDQLQDKIQKWLSTPDSSVNHNIACEAHHDDTAAWFLEGPIYDRWKKTGSLQTLLWTHGNPGSGKSVLCSSIIENLKSLRATGLASVAYYYFDFKDPGKQDRRGLLSSLLTQLCTQSHLGYDILSSLYERHENGLRQPKEAELIRCLKDVLALPGHGRVYIIVDAVDESPNKPGIPSPREKVMHLMTELVGLRHHNLRVCITSRPEVDIRAALEPLASHIVSLHDEWGQKRDIISYIKSVVQSDLNMRKWRPEDRQLVIDSLSEKADGMFRWVVCQLDTLRRCFPASIRHALDKLPMTLDETYERILLGIDREKREHAIRLLKCLAFSRRPLRVKELAEVLSIQFDTEIPRLDTSLRPEDADEAILSACSTLVTIIKPDYLTLFNNDFRVVQFSHYSVKEFLTSERLAKSEKGDISQYYISAKPAHTVLAQTCVSILLQSDLPIGDNTDSFPLTRYAAQNWFHHARFNGVASQIQDGMENIFDPGRKHFTMWISIHDIDNRWSWGPSTQTKACPLYYATLCGIESLVEHLLVIRQQNPNESHGRLGTPLHVAVVSGYTTIARLLLEHNTDVNARDRTSITPFQAAVRGGNIDIAQLLLSHGANVNAHPHRGDPLLHRAIQSQRLDVVKFLLKGGADVKVRSMCNLTPLHEAARSGNLDIVQLLLSHGADVNARAYRGDSLLHEAVRSQKLGIVELLLKGGADVNALSNDNLTPLHEAAGSGNLDIAQLLLSQGAYVNIVDHQENSPLGKAVQSQKHDVVELLLKGGADANARSMYNVTPLHEAAGGGNLDIMKLLLSHGAYVNSVDHQGNSPLRKAVRSQKHDVVALLLKGGADVNVRNKQNVTPLHEAAGSGNLDIVRLLLSHGADVIALDHFGDSPLHEASQQQNYATTRLLLRYGADANARGWRHKTPLHLASLGGSLETSRLLMEHGADVDAQDDEGQTPFSIALAKGHRKLARFLSNDRDVLEHGAQRLRSDITHDSES